MLLADPAPVPFQPDRFHTAAAHYLAGRPAYAPQLFRRVAEFCGLTRQDRVMDLGCGPGQLAAAFAPLCGAVLAVDPEPAMLQAAAEVTAGLGNVTLVEGSSNDLGSGALQGAFRLVTIGRAFHWMDRAETLRRLDRMIPEGGAVALFHDRHPEQAGNAWLEDFRAITDRYAGPDSWRLLRHSPDWVRHEAVLLASPFRALETVAVIEARSITVDMLVDRALSMSTTSPGRLGAQLETFCAELRSALARHAADGRLTEVIATSALVARRHF